jgi:hypothetical protein
MRHWPVAAIMGAAVALAAVPEHAIVPPTNCGMQTVSYQRY